MIRKTPIVRKTPLKRSTKAIARTAIKRSVKPIAKKSDQQKKRDAKYYPIRNEFLEKNDKCQAQWDGSCLYHASEVHHTKGKIGYLYFAVKWFLAVCRNCHNKIGDNHAEAEKRGFVFSRDL